MPPAPATSTAAPAVTGALFTLFAVAAVAVMLSRLATLSDRRGPAMPIASGFAAFAVTLTIIATRPGLPATAAAVVLFGIGFGLAFPAMAATVNAPAHAHRRGRAFGVFMAFYSLGFVVVPPLGGAVGDRWPTAGPFLTAALVCAAGAAALLATDTLRRRSTQHAG